MVLAVVGGGLALAAYVFTDNLSTAIIIFCITAGLIFVAHPDIKIFIIIAGVVIALAVIGIIFLNATVSVDGSGSFRLRRIMVWLHPEEYADSWGYQTIQALYAIGSGGFFIEDGNQYLGCFLCQGKMPMQVREKYLKMRHLGNEEQVQKMLQNFDKALLHPDWKDMENAQKFVHRIYSRL